MDILLIVVVAAIVLAVGYLILRKTPADVDLNAGHSRALQRQANDTLDAHLRTSEHRSIHRRNGRFVYDDGSFITDLILLDILMDGELDFNFIPEYDEVAIGAHDNVSAALDDFPVEESLRDDQIFEQGAGGMEYRDTPEAAVETVSTEPERNYRGDSYGGGGGSDGGYDSGGGDSGGSSDD